MNVCVGRMVISSNRLLISELMFGKFGFSGGVFKCVKKMGGGLKFGRQVGYASLQ